MALINLDDFLLQYPHFSLAQKSDEKNLRAFFENTPMQGSSIEMTYLRSPNFFAFLKAHSDHYYVFVLKNEEGEIQGAGTVVIRPAYNNGDVTQVAYLGDLRIQNIRQWGKVWKVFYADFLKKFKQIKEFSGVNFLYTCVLSDNKKALLALNKYPGSLGYYHFHDYKMVNILRQIWKSGPSSYLTKNWTDIPLDHLFKFYQVANQKKPLGFVFEETYNECQWRLTHWPGFSRSSGWCIGDGEKILASAAFWSPALVKRIHIKKLAPSLKWAFKLISIFSTLPKEGEDFKVLYLTMLDFAPGLNKDQQDELLIQLIDQGLKKVKQQGFHALSLPEFDCFRFDKVLRPYLYFKHDLKLFLVDPHADPRVKLSHDQVPGFEMSLV